MCGIAAIVARGGEQRLRDALSRMSRAMASRGPDGEGTFVGASAQGGLGHRRLALVDREGGAQPIVAEHGRVAVVVNGEIYDHARVRAELQRAGHRFRTESDSEVVLHLYEAYGPSFVARLRGEFAIAIWDDARRRLVVARDPFGIKPVLYAALADGIAVASTARALFAAGVPARFDRDAIEHVCTMQYTLPGETLFERVRTLPGGSLMLYEDGRLHIERWYAHAYSPTPIDDAPDRLLAALDDAVRARATQGGRAGFQLSGGIDSASVVALGARHVTRPLAFTVAFDDPAYDERALAAETARSTGVDLHVVAIDELALANQLAPAVIAGEGVAINAHLVGKHALARAARDEGVQALLTGEGSDELFAGYAHLREDVGSATEHTNAASRGVMLPIGAELDTSAVDRALGYTPTFLRAKAGLGHRLHALRANASPTAPFTDLAAWIERDRVRRTGRVATSLHLWIRLVLEGYILRTLGDAMEMAHGIEGRVPFLDPLVVDLARSLDVEAMLRGGVEKKVLRTAMCGLVPERVRTREKHPFLAPPLLARSARTRGPAAELLLDLVRSARFAELDLFDPARVEAAITRAEDATDLELRALDPVLFIVASLAILDAYLIAGERP